MPVNFKDFYIGYKGHPRYESSKFIEDDVIRVIVQKYEMIIFTNKGELLGDPSFGADLPLLLHETRLSEDSIQGDINAQIFEYIPEISNIPYTLEVNIYDDPERHQEWMEILFQIRDLEVYATVI
jgi:hypothetical protein